MRSLLRRWLVILQVTVFLFAIAAPAASAANPPALQGDQLIQLLRSYRIVQGDPTGNLNLDKPITRAEMITIAVRAIGGESEAARFQGYNMFSDTVGHWASSYINYAAMKQLIKGDGNGLVRPNDQITYAEALTLLLRVAGKEPTTGTWPVNILLTAANLGLVPNGVNYSTLSQNAIRGPIFESLGTALVTVNGSDGKSLLQTYVDHQPPTITLNQLSDKVTTESVNVSGTVSDAVSVTVNGVAATLTGTSFAATVPVNYGANTITVTATDVAGNQGTKTASVQRNAVASRIEVSGTTNVPVNTTSQITATAYAADGTQIPDSQVTASVSGNAGTYDAATHTFRAGATSGTATLTFAVGTVTKPVTVNVLGLAANAVGLTFDATSALTTSVGSTGTVKVNVIDGTGHVLTDDNGRDIIMILDQLTGATVTPTIAKTVNGVATFTVSSASAGILLMTAKSGDLSFAQRLVTFATPTHVVLTASQNSILADGASTSVIRAKLVDQNGNPVNNDTLYPIVISLSRGGLADGMLSQDTLSIPVGASLSNDSATYSASATLGSATINGSITQGAGYTVLGTTITQTSFGSGSSGGGDSGSGGSTAGPAYRLEFLGTGGVHAPGDVDVLLRVSDSRGQTVTSGNYAFFVTATTDNGDTLGTADPSRLNVTLGSTTSNTGIRPIQGVNAGVTTYGTIHLTVHYNRSGVVTLTPVATSAVDSATGRDETGAAKAGSSTSGINTPSITLSFSSGATASAVGLTAAYSSSSLTYSNVTDAPSPISTSITLTASLLDSNGGVLPDGAQNITLYKYVDGTNDVNLGTKGAVNGKATFTVTAPNDNADVQYYAKVGALQSTPGVTIHSRKTALAAPVVTAQRGADSNEYGTEVDKVKLSDSYLQFLVDKTSTTNSYGVIKVYRNNSTLIYTSDPMRLDSGLNIVNVPKDKVSTGDSFTLTFQNGAGESSPSAPTNQIKVEKLLNVSIYSARYDAKTSTLTVNLNTSLGSATLDATKLTLTAPGGATFTPTSGAPTGSSQFVLNLTGQPGVNTLLNSTDPNRAFAGNVLLTASQGWVYESTGETAAAVTQGVAVTPFASVLRSYIDLAGNRVVVDTVGVTNSSNWDTSMFQLGTVTLARYNSVTADPYTNGRYFVSFGSLTQTQKDYLATYNGSLTLSSGWYYTDSSANAAGLSVPTYAFVTVRGATYNKTSGVLTLTGTGFSTLKTSGLDITKLTFKDESNSVADFTLNIDATTVVNATSDTSLSITLKGTNKSGVDAFSGNLVFLTAADGWFTTAANLAAPPVTGHQAGVGFSN